jgi:hypothetical protein
MRKYLVPLLIFAISFVYYLFQCCPTFYFWDSAELTAAVLGGGVPHPPGFPALLVIAKIWTMIIPLNKAYALNLLSSLFASLGLAFWYLCARRVLQRIFPDRQKIEIAILALVSIILLGISFSYSIQAVRFEVYSLNFACFAVLMFLTLKTPSQRGSSGLLFAVGSVLAAAIALGGHHFTIALAFPGIIAISFLNGKLNLRRFLCMAAAVLILLIPLYLSIYLYARTDPVLNWGDPSNWDNFLDYFFLREFDMPLSSLAPAHLARNLAFAAELIVNQVGILGLLLGLWGIFRLFGSERKLAIPLLSILVLNLFSILYFEDFFLDNYDLHGYLLFSVALLALFVSVSIGFLSDYLKGFIQQRAPLDIRIMGLAAVLAVATVVILMPLDINLFSADLSRVTEPEEYAGMFLNDAPDSSLIVTSYYDTYFCLLAYKSLHHSDADKIVTNVYNWDHDWGKRQTALLLNLYNILPSKRSEFYRNLINGIKDSRPIYVEYNQASAPLVNFLKPSGLGYLFSTSDTSLAGDSSYISSLDYYLDIAGESRDIESTRLWVLWYVNGGQFYANRGREDLSLRYFGAAETVASLREE